ncbi:hypothetical protein [Neobacillus piezotolerans]|uniref:hypothetical protein n=1 Tax=Neobacillus piezotolerans TaxID=2259171 RepID=UPI00115BCA51|nr:hypothetical protein [Neobacillus piezotolerans]
MNFYQYQKNLDFQQSLGASFQNTVRKTIFHLDDPAGFWQEELKNENGNVALERHRGKLEANADKFNAMGGNMGVMGDQLHYLSKLYWNLAIAVSSGAENTRELNEQIEGHRSFITEALKETNDHLGEDEMLWFNELSNPDSQTSKQFWEEFKAFESGLEN